MYETRPGSGAGGFSSHRNLLDEPGEEGLLRLTNLVEHLFRVPIAFLALLNADAEVGTRIGSGDRYWDNLRTFLQGACTSAPTLWPGPSEPSIPDFDYGELRFTAAVPLRASDGLPLGALVIADVIPRPEFVQRDLEVLLELAGVLAGTMELRLLAHIAHRARESRSSIRDTEDKFRSIAEAQPEMIVYSGAEGRSAFEARERPVLKGPEAERQRAEGRGTPRFLKRQIFRTLGCFTELTTRAAVCERRGTRSDGRR